VYLNEWQQTVTLLSKSDSLDQCYIRWSFVITFRNITGRKFAVRRHSTIIFPAFREQEALRLLRKCVQPQQGAIPENHHLWMCISLLSLQGQPNPFGAVSPLSCGALEIRMEFEGVLQKCPTHPFWFNESPDLIRSDWVSETLTMIIICEGSWLNIRYQSHLETKFRL
jgi:hypothetical protein